MRFTRTVLPGLLVLVALAGCGGGSKEVNVYNWSDYIAPDTVQKFTAETGIQVNYDVFDSNEVLETKLMAGSSGYDVVVPTASFMERQIKAGAFLELDRSKLPNLVNMDPEIMRQVARHDPGNRHSVNYMWGSTGIGYNKAKVEAALGGPIESWAAVFDPEQASKLQACGLAFLDSQSEMAAMMLAYLGKDPNSRSEEDLKQVEEQFMKVRPFVRYVHSSQYINDLSNGEICAAVGYNGDMLQARDRARESGNGIEVVYVVPKEGSLIWFDMLAIPADAPHPDEAHAFINFLMKPEIIAEITNTVKFANGNKAALEFVDEEVKNDPAVYPPPEVMARLVPDLAEPEEYTRLLTRMWTRFRTGQ